MEAKLLVNFSMMEYLSYLDGQNNSRCVREGENVFNAGHVILCGKKEDTSPNSLQIYALCLKTSALNDSPHIIEGDFIFENGSAIVNKMHCSCKAGTSGRCKHISAVLIQCMRSSLQLETLSQTEITCAWSTCKPDMRTKYAPIPVCKMTCMKKDRAYPNLNISDADASNSILEEAYKLDQSSISLHKLGRNNDLLDKCTIDLEYITSIVDCASQSIVMMDVASIWIGIELCCQEFISKNFDSNIDSVACKTFRSKKLWHQERQFRISGSKIYEIYTYQGKDWASKCEKFFWPKTFTNKFVRHGITQEPIARKYFKMSTGADVRECGFIISPSNRWVGYSPDGIIFENNKPTALLEIKCPFEGKIKNIQDILQSLPYIEVNGDEYVLKRKHKYFCQIQTGLSVLNLNLCYFVVFCSHDKSCLILKVNFDYNYCKNVLSTVKSKYFNHMLHKVCSR